MRYRRSAVLLLVLMATLALAVAGSADVYYRMLFERAVFLLETRMKPLSAIPIFQEIIRRHGNDRHYAALSQLYIGLCRKWTDPDQARRDFEEVLSSYPEQSDVIRIAAAELGGLKADETAVRRAQPKSALRLVRRLGEGSKVCDISEDGRYMALIEMDSGRLVAYDRAENETRGLTPDGPSGGEGGFAEEAAISSDARQVAYSWRNEQGGIELKVVGIDGTGSQTLLSGPDLAGIQPAGWGPSGEDVLAVLLGADLQIRLGFVSLSDRSIRPVLELGGRWPEHVRLSPDGRHLAYALAGGPGCPEGDIFLYSFAENTVTALVRQPGHDQPIGWTADGRRILYAAGGPEAAGVWLIGVRDGSPVPPARRCPVEMGPIDPIALTRDGTLYFRSRSGTDGRRDRRGPTALWAKEEFLPEDGRILTVPGEFATIQEAVHAASPGDTVQVGKGLYEGPILIDKSLTLQGEGRRDTMIRGGKAESVINITAGDVIVSGVTVTGGTDGILVEPDLPIRHITLRSLAVTDNSGRGIHSIGTAGEHVIEDCVLSDNGSYAVDVHQFSRGVIRKCEVFRNGGGLRPAWSWHILVEENQIHHNLSVGLLLDSCYNSIIRKNLIYANGGPGINVLYIASRNTIRENAILGNSSGIYINLEWTGFGENRFYHNDIMDNRLQVNEAFPRMAQAQYWDIGEPSGGNFWSDYAGEDGDGDGTGDSPHPLIAGARDGFPLMKPMFQTQADLELAQGGSGVADPGEWLTVRIELPAGLPVEDIDRTRLVLNGSLGAGGTGGAAVDSDDDGIPELEVRFSRRAVRRLLQRPGAGPDLVVSGKLKNGLRFEARTPARAGDR
jgi:nitrous oxidase accessory protein